ncbi:MAG: metal-dependent transcriptional regulator [Acidobacteriota bacterium]
MTERTGLGLGESLEDYLEAILALERETGMARVSHISSRLSVSKPSVTGALRILKEKRLVCYKPYGTVTLTPSGKRIAGEVARRHRVLKRFLTAVLLLGEESAEAAACRMEHVLSATVIERFCAFADYLGRCPRGAPLWVAGTGFACPHRGQYPECETCAVPAVAADAGRTVVSTRSKRTMIHGKEAP